MLIANDEAIQLSLLKCLFELSHSTVECFPNGFDALNSVNALHQAIKQGSIIPMYDLIVHDLNMPILDGFDTSISIRSLFDQLVDPNVGSENVKVEIPLIVANTADSVSKV